ncbi:muramoyltetrapeptide carboxypeptidase [Mucilaginibacter gracilis]|uniref:Muramoyltetrapeptide carboxypeptidase n=1 Tax=Mucilaginibacter gracilis TaxID=423350 RepID=A0A495IYN0_9SPHI|nr:LD-carboxypeptidase [Mucilaginibacter gracilis]RKR81816.1 muramoyltetrapeptide carboxypeptidase [Mucilaginibacter gracilis]
MSISPPYLKKGDKVAITCPAKKLPAPMTDAIALLELWGLEVVLGETINASYHQFAGDDNLRARDMQRFLDDEDIKAIIAARGGYGTVRMIDKLDFTKFAQNPKWVVGFSDITVLHTHIWANYGVQTIHGQMPVNVKDGSEKSLETLRMALFGEAGDYEFKTHAVNRPGEASGQLIGGNLSLLAAVSGSVSDIDYQGKILFIEDVGEYLYAIDRMMYTLKRAGRLKNLAGLVVGGFTEIKDNDIPFGQTVPEIIMAVVSEYNYPVCFDFPAGHLPDNRALILGKTVNLLVNQNHAHIKYI